MSIVPLGAGCLVSFRLGYVGSENGIVKDNLVFETVYRTKFCTNCCRLATRFYEFARDGNIACKTQTVDDDDSSDCVKPFQLTSSIFATASRKFALVLREYPKKK
ncbi:hypothetical protein EAI_02198 [Harpegnathos saltator]|uniref:Uncharacterized protein n=1 Tax=Harpegnathos saltator TaxID=610380 RepID=E2BLQ1_HARSA|nr:hypothetical protein EAI_02198 [Harpegnathos saltator]